jgi:hypothetical protein
MTASARQQEASHMRRDEMRSDLDESDLRTSGYHFALFLPFSRHNLQQLAATPGAIRQLGNWLTSLE